MTTPHGATQQFRDDVPDEGTPASGQEASHDYDGPDGAFRAHVCAASSREKSLYGEFCTHKLPFFDGSTDSIFTVLRCSSEEKVDLAMYMLTGEAYDWWQIIRPLLVARRHLTWWRFQTAFFEQYFPESFNELEAKFATIEQGTDSVADYVAQNRFSQPLLEDKKTKKLIKGFKPSIINLLSVHGLPSYTQAIDRARTSEINEEHNTRESGGHRKRAQSEGQSSDTFSG
ncbi:unnamed protein product [Malus baccata var. baccata]